MSEYGNNSRRPYPPTATSAIPCGKAVDNPVRNACVTVWSTEVVRLRSSAPASSGWAVIGRGPTPALGLKRGFATIVAADSNRFRDVKDEDLAVADVSSTGRAGESA